MSLKLPYQIEPQAVDGVLIKSQYVEGTLTIVETDTERDNLPGGTQVIGSLCYVSDDAKFYVWNGTSWQDGIYTKSQLDQLLAAKQATLVSGTNIKTVNGNSLLGSGNLTVSGTGDVVGPSSSTTNAIPVFSSTTGKAIANSALTITTGAAGTSILSNANDPLSVGSAESIALYGGNQSTTPSIYISGDNKGYYGSTAVSSNNEDELATVGNVVRNKTVYESSGTYTLTPFNYVLCYVGGSSSYNITFTTSGDISTSSKLFVPEYKGRFGGSSGSYTITFPSGTTILCGESDVTVTNNVLTFTSTAASLYEFSIQDEVCFVVKVN